MQYMIELVIYTGTHLKSGEGCFGAELKVLKSEAMNIKQAEKAAELLQKIIRTEDILKEEERIRLSGGTFYFLIADNKKGTGATLSAELTKTIVGVLKNLRVSYRKELEKL